jgi:hypothetical protein
MAFRQSGFTQEPFTIHSLVGHATIRGDLRYSHHSACFALPGISVVTLNDPSCTVRVWPVQYGVAMSLSLVTVSARSSLGVYCWHPLQVPRLFRHSAFH